MQVQIQQLQGQIQDMMISNEALRSVGAANAAMSGEHKSVTEEAGAYVEDADETLTMLVALVESGLGE